MRHPARLAAFAAFVTLAAGTFASSAARAQSAETLQAERARLRAQLDKVNAEIDGLKHASRGMRDDYRLRARLADAESLARRLIDIEARLGIRVDGAAKVGPPPTAAPTDGPADLDAKADILANQSRRIRAQADALAAAPPTRRAARSCAGRPRTSTVIRSRRWKDRSGASPAAPAATVTPASAPLRQCP